MESHKVRDGTIHTKEKIMRKGYDFSKAIKNPYAKRVKRQLTIRVDDATIAYFRSLAEEVNVPYQTLINMYLRDCVDDHQYGAKA